MSKALKRYRLVVWAPCANGSEWRRVSSRELDQKEARLMQGLSESLGFGAYWCDVARPVNGKLVSVERYL